MKKYFGFLFGLLTVTATVWAVDPTGFRDVYIKNSLHIGGTGAANSKTVLDASGSTTKGILLPSLTLAQEGAISSPVEGLLIYDSDDHTFAAYRSGAWGDASVPLQAIGNIGKPLISGGGMSSNTYSTLLPGGGGIGLTSITAHNLLIGNGTSAANLLAPVAGSVLVGTSSSADPSYTISPTIGVNGTSTGQLNLATSAGSGQSVTIQNLNTTSAWNFNVPSSAGSPGQILTTQGGGSNIMTWSTALTDPAANAFEMLYQNSGNTALTNLAANTTTTKKLLSMIGTGSAGQAPSWSPLIGSDLLSQGAMSVFASNGTFTTPSNSSTSTIYKYLAIGCGGGGGGTNNSSGSAGGGQAGGIAMGTFTSVAASTGITITVSSSGGSAGSTGGGNGGTGADSSIGSPVTVTAHGGNGGTGASTATNAAGGSGAGTVTGATLGITGAIGLRGLTGYGGKGAESMIGGGGIPGASGAGGGGGATGFGAGGGGAIGTTAAGGAGAPGLVIIWQLTP